MAENYDISLLEEDEANVYSKLEQIEQEYEKWGDEASEDVLMGDLEYSQLKERISQYDDETANVEEPEYQEPVEDEDSEEMEEAESPDDGYFDYLLGTLDQVEKDFSHLDEGVKKYFEVAEESGSVDSSRAKATASELSPYVQHLETKYGTELVAESLLESIGKYDPFDSMEEETSVLYESINSLNPKKWFENIKNNVNSMTERVKNGLPVNLAGKEEATA